MKKFLGTALGYCALAFLVLFGQGCLKDSVAHTYTIYAPIYKSREEVRANIKSNPPKEIQSPGKLFIYGNYIFLNEIDKGVHVIDNTDPSHPVTKAFIDIPGNLDIAVKGNTLYADMYGYLVAVDITDPLHAALVKDMPGVFPERSYQGGFVAANGMLIVGWEKKDTTVKGLVGSLFNKNLVVMDAAVNFSGVQSMSSSSGAPGIAGSMARFSLVNDYLYTVDRHTLKTFSLVNAHDPVNVSSVNAGWDIETIYPLKNKLFVGSMGGMFIFDISNPITPVLQSNFVHARACDPVVADDHYAYITLRAGTMCGPTNNELQIVNIDNITAPVLSKTYSMVSPQGISKDGTTLFVCDGSGGLKVYDASDVMNLHPIKTISGLDTYDVIAWNKNALVVARGGLYQYDYSDLNNIRLRSQILVKK